MAAFLLLWLLNTSFDRLYILHRRRCRSLFVSQGVRSLSRTLSLSGLWIRADNIMFYYYCHLCVRKAYRVWYAMYGIYALMNDDNTK